MTFILPSFGASAIAAVPGGGGGFSNDFSVDFDGSDDFMDTGSNFTSTFTSAFTISCWFKRDNGSGTGAMFGQWHDSNFRHYAYVTGGSLIYDIRIAGTAVGAPTMSIAQDTNWHHVAVTVKQDSSNVVSSIYLDGVSGGTNTVAATLSNFVSTADLAVGKRNRPGGTEFFFAGLIDEVSIIGSALSDGGVSSGQTAGGDIATLYNSGNGPADISAFNPVAWYRMGDSDTGVSNGSSTPTIVSNVANSSAIQNHYALDFDGSNDYLSLGNLGTAGRSLGSMLFWVNITSTNGIHSANLAKFLVGFGGAGGGFYWGYWGTNTDLLTLALHSFNRRTRFNAPSAGDKLTAGWHLIGVNHNGTSYDIIIDGVTAPNATLNSGSTGSYSIQNATSIISGTDFDDVKVMTNTAGSYASEGLVDEFAIWDSALSSSDITAIYNSGVPTDLTSYSPAGWWRMGDGGTWNGSNWSIPDASANSNTGTTANMVEADRATDTPTANAILKNGPTYSTNVPT